MSQKTCPYCGRNVRENDKFCIFCGKPLLVNVSKSNEGSKPQAEKNKAFFTPQKEKESGKKSAKEESKEKKKDSSVPFTSGDLEPPGEEPSKKSKDELMEDKEKKKTVPFAEDEEDFSSEELDLEDDIREQLVAKMDYALLNTKKLKLKEKLDDLMRDVKSERYDQDIDYAKEINLKLEAVKEIQKQLQEEDDKLREKIGIFKFDELQHVIEERRAQLTELKRKYKLGKIKENIFKQLKQEYSMEYRKAQENLKKYQKQIKIWISKLKTEKNREEIKLKLVEGRYSTKEIDKERMESEKSELQKIIDQYDQKINVLRNFANTKF